MRQPDDSGKYEAFARAVKGEVEAALACFLGDRVTTARLHATDVGVVADAMRALAMRGGKRVRAVLLAAAYEGCEADHSPARPITMALVAIELLQTYLLIHDDWMDDDDTRRGGPSVHALLRERFGSTRAGAVTAILAGDLASALSMEALLATPLPHDRLVAAAAEFARMEATVVMGQILDVRSAATLPKAVEAMHDLKTGSYTVRGPISLGAILAGASTETRAALDAFARPLGIAFQLRDDLLGTFGDATRTGKPRGSDIRKGKHTALIAELGGDPGSSAILARVHGKRDASEADVERLTARLESTGAKARVEARLACLLEEAETHLHRARLAPSGAAVLRGAILALGEREH